MLTNFQFLQILLNVYKMKPKLERKKKKGMLHFNIYPEKPTQKFYLTTQLHHNPTTIFENNLFDIPYIQSTISKLDLSFHSIPHTHNLYKTNGPTFDRLVMYEGNVSRGKRLKLDTGNYDSLFLSLHFDRLCVNGNYIRLA